MQISQNGINLIKTCEGLRLSCYLDAGGYATIGYGHKLLAGENWETITEAQADSLLLHDISIPQKIINDAVKVPLTQNQFDALCDFIFNVGATAFLNSTFLKLLNAGQYTQAAAQFKRWNKVNSDIINGLTLRRLREENLFLGGQP